MSRSALMPWLLGGMLALTGVTVSGYSGTGPMPEAAPRPASDSLASLRLRLDELLDSPALARSRVGVEVMDCATGEILYERNGRELLVPASNLKVLTSAAALEVLGPAFRFQTTILRDGVLDDGVLKGNLYLRGEGNPELVYETVWKMVKDLQAQGLTTITGDLVADDSYFDQERSIADWAEDEADDETHAYNAPLGALSVNFNTVALIVRPGRAVREPVRVTFETPLKYVSIDNRALTGKANSAMSLRFSRATRGDRPELILDGRMPINHGFKRFYRTVPDPPRFALAMVSEMMAREGITLKGKLREGKTPDSAVPIHYHYSSSLDILLKYMNKLSSNFIAEQLVKAMGAKVYGAPGTTEKGLRVMRDWLNRAGLPWEQAIIMNGSGLSYHSRVSAHQLVTVLRHVESDFQRRYDYLATLPIAGLDGTMRNRMRGTPAAGVVRAKTGSVRGVFGFSGYMRSADQRTLAFSFLVNDIRGSVAAIKRVQDLWANLLVAGTGGEVDGPTDLLPDEAVGEGEVIGGAAEEGGRP